MTNLGVFRGCHRLVHNATVQTTRRPVVVTAISLFFFFGTTMSALAAVMLFFPGSLLEPLWRLNPQAQAGFAAMGLWAVCLMVAGCAACATAAVGLWRCARWGYITAVIILSVNLAGDTANALIGHDWRTLIGLPIGGVMIAYLVKVRGLFGGRREAPTPASLDGRGSAN
jgi:hypothetical protein